MTSPISCSIGLNHIWSLEFRRILLTLLSFLTLGSPLTVLGWGWPNKQNRVVVNGFGSGIIGTSDNALNTVGVEVPDYKISHIFSWQGRAIMIYRRPFPESLTQRNPYPSLGNKGQHICILFFFTNTIAIVYPPNLSRRKKSRKSPGGPFAISVNSSTMG